MPFFDLPLSELERYSPPSTREPDYDTFWAENLRLSAAQPLRAELNQLEYPVKTVKVYKVFYDGFGGGRICGLYLLPSAPAPAGGYPALLVCHGYSCGKGLPVDHLHWVLQGFAVLSLDPRGQSGESVDTGTYSFGARPGWMTKGILDKNEYYYRRVYLDHLRGLEFLRERPEIDPDRIGVTGASQGGGLTLAVAALAGGRIAAAMPDVPFLCHFRRALEITDAYPYREIADFIKTWPDKEDQVYRTLSYFDNMNWTDRIACPVLMSVGLQDQICPPSTVYAAFNRIKSEKRMMVYPYSGHEGGGSWQTEAKVAWAAKYILEKKG